MTAAREPEPLAGHFLLPHPDMPIKRRSRVYAHPRVRIAESWQSCANFTFAYRNVLFLLRCIS